MLAEIKLKLELSKQRLEFLGREKNKLEEDIKNESNNLHFLENQIDEVYSKLKKYNKRDQQIYIERHIYGWSNDKISANHDALTRQQIARILKKIEQGIEN